MCFNKHLITRPYKVFIEIYKKGRDRMEKEVWKDIPGYEGLYQASNLGRIKSLSKKLWNGHGYFYSKEKILKPGLSSNKEENKRRLMVVLCKDVKKTWSVHKLIAITFLGEKPEELIICHNDGNHLNNRVDNLRYDSYKENTRDILKHDRTIAKSKLNIENIINIRKEYSNGVKVKNITKKYNISENTVYNIISKRTYSWVK